jgi:translation initiation factor IF-3
MRPWGRGRSPRPPPSPRFLRYGIMAPTQSVRSDCVLLFQVLNSLQEPSIARLPAQETAPSRNDGPRVNHQINVPQVRLVREDGSMVGVVSTREAISMAADAGLDLVEVSPNATPPVCKILDFGKFKYEEQKRKNEARKKQKVIEVKEIKLRPGIDTHDYDVKMRSIHRFLEEGDKVKVTMRFRGREMAHQELGAKVLDRVKTDLDAIAKVESAPKMEGRQMIMVISPK